MKYKTTKSELFDVISTSVITTVNDVSFVGFPAEVGNPNYDAFLEQAKLTDTQVKALKPDTWYDFPKE